MKKLFSSLLILFLIPSIYAENIGNDDVEVQDLYCTDDGKFGFKVTPIRDFGQAELRGVLIKQAGDNNFLAAKGNWNRENIIWDGTSLFRTATFTSSEAEIKNAGDVELKFYYRIGAEDKEMSLFFDCQGTKFSCKVFDVGVNSCSSSKGVFTAEFRTKGLKTPEYREMADYSIDDLTFSFVSDGRFCDKSGACGRSAGIPETATVDVVNDELVRVTWNYEANIKGASIVLEAARSCERKEVNYDFKVSDFKSCDPDPFVKKFTCTGCELGNICVLEGDSIIVEGKDLFCINKKLSEQKKVGSSCSQNVECLTNNCIAGVCSNQLLEKCNEGSLSSACKCGSLDVRTYEGKSCCDGEVYEGECPIIDDNTGSIDDNCSAGFVFDGQECVRQQDSQNNGFWSKIGDFFKNLFKRR